MGRRPSSPSELRDEVAAEAARLMVDHGIEDYAHAKRKAAERLGVRAVGGGLPSNGEIHAQIQERLRLYEPDAGAERLTQLRRLAVDVMELLEPFRPRLVGPVLDGSATAHSSVELHVFSDSPEAVAETLAVHRLLPRDHERRYRFSRDVTEPVPGYTLRIDGEEVDVMVFGERGAAHAPLSPVDGRPMRRAGRAAVVALLESSAGPARAP